MLAGAGAGCSDMVDALVLAVFGREILSCPKNRAQEEKRRRLTEEKRQMKCGYDDATKERERERVVV